MAPCLGLSLQDLARAPRIAGSGKVLQLCAEYTDGKYNIGGDIPGSVLDYLHWLGTLGAAPVSAVFALCAPGNLVLLWAICHDACVLVYAYDFVLDTDINEYLWLNASVAGLVKPMHAVTLRKAIVSGRVSIDPGISQGLRIAHRVSDDL